jgi:hypothetical protein
VAVLELDGKITQWKSAIASANNVMQSASQFGKIEQQTYCSNSNCIKVFFLVFAQIVF